MLIRVGISLMSLARFGRRFLIIFIVCNILELWVALLTNQRATLFQCYMDTKPLKKSEEKQLQSLEDVLYSEVKPTPGRSIFFHETRCHSPKKRYILNLNARQACSIESAALNNPNLQIFVLFTSPTFLWKATKGRNSKIKALLSYNNVHFRQLNLWRYAENTPIEDWTERGELFRSRFDWSVICVIQYYFKMIVLSFLTVHASDLLRMLSLYRFGGIYLDLDVVVLRSLEDLPLNFMGAQLNTSIGNSVMGLEPHGVGHQLAELVLQDFQQQYDGDIWAQNGPRCLTRVMSEFCATDNINEMIRNPDSCNGLRVHNISSFYEINWEQWFHFFEPRLTNLTLHRLRDSYVAHIWSHINSGWPLRVDSNAAYIQLARRHCPRVLAASKKKFN